MKCEVEYNDAKDRWEVIARMTSDEALLLSDVSEYWHGVGNADQPIHADHMVKFAAAAAECVECERDSPAPNGD